MRFDRSCQPARRDADYGSKTRRKSRKFLTAINMFWGRTVVYKLCSSRRKNSWKKTVSILATLMLGVWLLNITLINKNSGSVLLDLHVEESDFKPIPYASLAPCERNVNGGINCPDIRHKGRTRLRQAQLVLTRILRIFDLIAKKYGIRYWLYRGTLIGAVRHNGHVPFDNDVDICIPKEDFEKFVKYGVKELPDDFFFQTEETDVHFKVPPWTGILGKLRDTRSCYKYCIESGCRHNDGLQLDMFVVESDSDGNFIEIYSHTNWFLRRFIYGPILRKHSEIFPLVEVNFDGFSLAAPQEWKKILTSLYGDFMKIPKNEPPGHVVTDTLHGCDDIKMR